MLINSQPTYTETQTCKYTRIHTHTHMHTHTRIHTHTHTHTHAHTQTHTHNAHAHMTEALIGNKEKINTYQQLFIQINALFFPDSLLYNRSSGKQKNKDKQILTNNF